MCEKLCLISEDILNILKYRRNESQNVFFLIHYKSEDVSGKTGVQRFMLKTTVF